MKQKVRYILLALSAVILVSIVYRIWFFEISFEIEENVRQTNTVPVAFVVSPFGELNPTYVETNAPVEFNFKTELAPVFAINTLLFISIAIPCGLFKAVE